VPCVIHNSVRIILIRKEEIDKGRQFVRERYVLSLRDIKTVAVEQWLSKLKGQDRKRSDGSIRKKGEALAPSTKAKLRNQMCALYSHAIRHELYDRNPISGTATVEGKRGSGGVRVSTKRLRTPDTLSLDEMKEIIARLNSPILATAVKLAAVTGLRRSEIRGLKWSALSVTGLWLKVERGIVRKLETKAKTEASRKGVPIPPELLEVLLDWRQRSLYRADSDWIFASEQTGGKNPSGSMSPSNVTSARRLHRRESRSG
jgi:integrase